MFIFSILWLNSHFFRHLLNSCIFWYLTKFTFFPVILLWNLHFIQNTLMIVTFFHELLQQNWWLSVQMIEEIDVLVTICWNLQFFLLYCLSFQTDDGFFIIFSTNWLKFSKISDLNYFWVQKSAIENNAKLVNWSWRKNCVIYLLITGKNNKFKISTIFHVDKLKKCAK